MIFFSFCSQNIFHINKEEGQIVKLKYIPKGNNEYLLKLSDVTMYDTEGVKVELRQWLLDQQYGEHMPEGYISLERAKERLEFEFQNEEMKKYLNNPDRDIYCVLLKFQPRSLPLRGNNFFPIEKILPCFLFF